MPIKLPEWAWVLPLLLLTTALGARGLNSDSLWFDEYFSVYNAGGAHYGPLSIGEVWQRVGEDIFETPGHYLLLSEWGKLVGWTEYAARSLSLLLGILSVAWMYRLGLELAGHVVGISAAVVTGASAFYVNYLHEMRTYTLVLLLTVMGIWLYWRIIHRRAGWLMWATFPLTIAGLAYAHYMAVLSALALALYHVLFVSKNRHWWQVSGLFVVALALFLPWMSEVFDTIEYAQTSETRQAIALGAPELVAQFAYMFSNAGVALLLLLLFLATQVRHAPARFVWFLSGCILVFCVTIALTLPVLNHPRYFIALWPSLAVLVGLGVWQLQRHRIQGGAVLLIWLVAGVWNTTDGHFSNQIRGGDFADLPWDTLADALAPHAQPDDLIVYHRPDSVWAIERLFEHYLFGLSGEYVIMETLPGRNQDNEFYQEAQKLLDDKPRVWLVVDQTRAPNFRLADFQRALADEFAFCGRWFERSTMYLETYARIPIAPDSAPLQFGTAIYTDVLEPLAEIVDGQVRLALGWSVGETVPPHTYSTALHVENVAGEIVAQLDTGLPEAGYHCQWLDVDLSALPAGEYRLLLTVYTWESGERLSGIHRQTSETNDRLTIGTVQIEG